MGSGRGARDRADDVRGASHPAVLAWSRLTGEAPAPARVAVLKRGRKSHVYRLGALPAAGAVVAKRCPIGAARIERMVHEEILPDLPVPALHWHGFIEDADPAFGWIFMEDAGNRSATSADGALLARWLGAVHAGGGERARRRLPERGAAQYLAQLRAGRARIAGYLAAAARPGDERALLTRVVARCDEVEDRWAEVEAACASLPPVLVHGDLARKNLRLRNRGGRDELFALDWEMAGWGTPVPELERLSPDRGVPDSLIRIYIARAGWTHLDRREAARLAWIGAVVRLAACIDWAGRGLGVEGYDKPFRQLRAYEARLAALLAGMPRGGAGA
ncbi:MAG TPA: phosphotransferase [Longimicrobiales bacterium]